MVTVILPGYSSKNRDWTVETAEKLQLKLEHEIRPIFWDHWTGPGKTFEVKDKARGVIDILLSNSVNIIAKSIGTLVACHIMQTIPGRVQKIIFCGIPLNDISEEEKEEIRASLKGFPPEQIICFQNEDDPHAGFDQVKDFINKINSKIEVVSKPRSDHEYPYYSEFQGFLKG